MVPGGSAASILLAFVASSIDDFFLLACLYADRRVPIRGIGAAKLAGAALSLSAAGVLASACVALPLSLSRLAGLVPLALGVKRLIASRVAVASHSAIRADSPELAAASTPDSASTCFPASARGFLRLLFIFIAASADNIALYIPLLTDGSRSAAVPAIVSAFAVVLPMTLLLCALAWLSSRVRLPSRLPLPMHRLRVDAAVPYLMMLTGIKALVTSLL
ncbi:hypothetical protein BTH42_13610 [Burkholderia sp. SRS-W-2-2016]|uniref:hypothetical protein n=1 Tax=Burkholderia sp. SRS-W-2-2016 TaxID=1926878 RepID=UPI00094B48B0|nr:hypothetical protein [Burkholderia sp. SRS-W-2-2016]OLL31227.1 hypothetical protein BTH42_13610 [Burkholderia sp. SRS-W-2-2016]